MSKNRFNRQILMFGEEGQEHIEGQKIGIVGLGGLGSQVVQALACLGVQKFGLIDDDVVDETNLNRLPGAFPEDIGRPKVDVARRHILRILPTAEVASIVKNVRTREAMEFLLGCSVIFGCVDHDGPRLVLTDLAAAYEITLIDLASEIFPKSEEQEFDFGGRVVVARPGDYCLFCANQIDRELAKEELETPDALALRRKHGYGLGSDASAPAVISLNGIVANLGVTEFIAMVTGIRGPARCLTYKGMRAVVTNSIDSPNSTCFTCGYLRGQKEKANIWRYLLPSEM
jgi:hypothetical protein